MSSVYKPQRPPDRIVESVNSIQKEEKKALGLAGAETSPQIDSRPLDSEPNVVWVGGVLRDAGFPAQRKLSDPLSKSTSSAYAPARTSPDRIVFDVKNVNVTPVKKEQLEFAPMIDTSQKAFPAPSFKEIETPAPVTSFPKIENVPQGEYVFEEGSSANVIQGIRPTIATYLGRELTPMEESVLLFTTTLPISILAPMGVATGLGRIAVGAVLGGGTSYVASRGNLEMAWKGAVIGGSVVGLAELAKPVIDVVSLPVKTYLAEHWDWYHGKVINQALGNFKSPVNQVDDLVSGESFKVWTPQGRVSVSQSEANLNVKENFIGGVQKTVASPTAKAQANYARLLFSGSGSSKQGLQTIQLQLLKQSQAIQPVQAKVTNLLKLNSLTSLTGATMAKTSLNKTFMRLSEMKITQPVVNNEALFKTVNVAKIKTPALTKSDLEKTTIGNIDVKLGYPQTLKKPPFKERVIGENYSEQSSTLWKDSGLGSRPSSIPEVIHTSIPDIKGITFTGDISIPVPKVRQDQFSTPVSFVGSIQSQRGLSIQLPRSVSLQLPKSVTRNIYQNDFWNPKKTSRLSPKITETGWFPRHWNILSPSGFQSMKFNLGGRKGKKKWLSEFGL